MKKTIFSNDFWICSIIIPWKLKITILFQIEYLYNMFKQSEFIDEYIMNTFEPPINIILLMLKRLVFIMKSWPKCQSQPQNIGQQDRFQSLVDEPILSVIVLFLLTSQWLTNRR